MRSPRVLVALVFLLAVTAGSARAVSTAADLCGGNADPCTVRRNLSADNGSVFDLGGRALVFEGGGRLDAGTGSMTIIARTLRLRPNSRIFARGGQITIQTTGNIELSENSRIDVSDTPNVNDFPGSLRLQSGGDIVIEGDLDASAALRTDGGVVELSGVNISVGVNGRINVAGGGLSAGGIVGILAQGTLGIAGPIDAPGGDSGGSVEIDAGSVATSARIDVSGGPQGGGALLDIVASGSVVIGGVISGEVDGPGTVVGTAAEISIFTPGTVELNEAMVLTGGVPAGEGGSLEVEAGGDIVQRGAINVSGRSLGGEVRLMTNGLLSLADIDVSGFTAGTLATLSVGGTRLTGTLAADATDELNGIAGSIDVAACTMDMDTPAVVSSVGVGGNNHLSSGGQMVIRGTLVAGEFNLLEYQDPNVVPVISGSLAPTSAPVANAGLDLCTIPGGGTTTTTLPGNCGTLADFDGLLCRLAAMTSTLGQASDDALGGKKSAKKMKKKVARTTLLAESARSATKAKKRGKKLKGADKQLGSFLKIVRKGQEKGKIDAALAGTLTGLGDAAALQIDQLRATP